ILSRIISNEQSIHQLGQLEDIYKNLKKSIHDWNYFTKDEFTAMENAFSSEREKLLKQSEQLSIDYIDAGRKMERDITLVDKSKRKAYRQTMMGFMDRREINSKEGIIETLHKDMRPELLGAEAVVSAFATIKDTPKNDIYVQAKLAEREE